MPAIHDPSEPEPSSPDRLEPDEPDGDDRDEQAPDDREHPVARRPNPLPFREEEEEELAAADILDELDLEDYDRRGGFFPT
jgi:hypothetical protein